MMRIILVSILLCLIALMVTSGQTKTNKEKKNMEQQPAVRFINPPTLSTPPGYTHVVEVRSGRTIYIAGQVALDKSGTLIGPDDMHAQTLQVFENLKAALGSVNATFDNVVKLNSYFVDMTQLPVFREVRDSYINTKNPPASTAVEVKQLARPGFLIEVEAIAIVPE